MSRDGELWIPRTMWEKRRQLSAVLNRSMMVGTPTLVLSCEDEVTFFSRIEVPAGEPLEYLQVASLLGADGPNATDLSRIMGNLGGKLAPDKRHAPGRFEQVLVDDVDLIIDLRSEEGAVASMFALLYALKARFPKILLFSNPLQNDHALEYFAGMRDFLELHAPPGEQNAA
ncbi:MAG: hypothetical protein HY075_06520 [Deltaproteobacteria bacterium]|nr:hypothetical protein [Deltaproteobacteria bacterium]